jgi:hypothetical protein
MFVGAKILLAGGAPACSGADFGRINDLPGLTPVALRRVSELVRIGGAMSDDDNPITLDDAIKLFPGARLTKSTLRAERDKGNLDIFRLGKRDYTTRKSMREMVRTCRENARRRVSTSTEGGINGSSETDQVSSARAALNQTVTALKQGLPRISGKSTRRSAGQTH